MSNKLKTAVPSDQRPPMIFPLGTGLLCGLSTGGWFQMLRENNFAVHPTCLIRAVAITLASPWTTFFGYYEKWRYGRQVAETQVKPPLFILGHWRSGTTHLHNLFSIDQRFTYPNFYQVLFPQTFLCSEYVFPKVIKPFLPATRPFDNVKLTFDAAAEDEFAICHSTMRSSDMSMIFPNNEDHYDKYLTLRDVPSKHLDEWRAGLLLFLKKLTWKHQKPIVLKSPHHTCRIRLLLEMFPDAKFVHIHRDPYTVFQSTLKMLKGWDPQYRLQCRDFNLLEERVIRQYKEMYDVFFREKELIPKGNFHEVCFEELEIDPLGEMQKAYEALSLPDFAEVEPGLRAYTETLADYQKNKHPEFDAEKRQRIATEWRRTFDEWGYPV